MYIDSVIFFGFAVIGLIFFMMGYIALYVYRQIKKENKTYNGKKTNKMLDTLG